MKFFAEDERSLPRGMLAQLNPKTIQPGRSLFNWGEFNWGLPR
jgi:hypothetical protein